MNERDLLWRNGLSVEEYRINYIPKSEYKETRTGLMRGTIYDYRKAANILESMPLVSHVIGAELAFVFGPNGEEVWQRGAI
jgi:hypothetical protein